MIDVTEKAADEGRRILTEQELPDTTALRVGVKGGGCSGFTYHYEFVSRADEADKVFEFDECPLSYTHVAAYGFNSHIDVHVTRYQLLLDPHLFQPLCCRLEVWDDMEQDCALYVSPVCPLE